MPFKNIGKIYTTIMKHLLSLIFYTALFACGTTQKESTAPVIKNKTPKIDSVVIENTADSVDSDNATYFIVVADTNINYYLLHAKMFKLSKKYNLAIDTMGRYYNTTKNLIALPDNDEDEIYAGDYYPRRFPSETLSLEYLNLYHSPSGEKTIALVTGIFETEKSADSALAILKRLEKKAFIAKANIYIGCMH